MTSGGTVEYRFGPFLLVPARRLLLQGEEPVRLGSRAIDILIALAERAGEVVSKEALMQRVWPHSVVEETGLRVHIAALRKALGEGRSGVRFIANVPMRGYCLAAPITVLHGAAPAGVQAPAADGAAPVPAPLTRVIGRDDAIEGLAAAASGRRLVTLVGPGGMGKTTVALATVERLRSHFADGVRFVDLGALAQGSLVASAAATALGVPVRTEDVLRDLVGWMSGRSVLLILDNCEHLVADAAAFVEALLAGAPHVHVLATSREPLRARGEWVQRLGSLTSPPADARMAYADAMAYPAFELFVERASASIDGIAFSDDDVVPIASVCLRLDGMPLAIELVAAQLGFYGLGGLLDKLDDHLSLPTLGHRTALPRHQTLRATLEWSYHLCSAAERRVLRRLSVFRERFTLAAADKVAREPDESAAKAIMGLVHKSLVVADASEYPVHYRLLETTRSFGRELLAASYDLQEINRRHCTNCLDEVALAAADIDVLLPARWRERHSRKVDDLRSAMAWAFGPAGDPQLGARLTAESASLWFGLWLVKEYLGHLRQALTTLPPGSQGSALEMQLSLEFAQSVIAMKGATAEAMSTISRSVEIARAIDAPDHEIRALWVRYGAWLLRGEYAQALADAEDYGRAAARCDSSQLQFIHHRMRAVCLHFLGQQAQALEHARRSLDPQADSIRYTSNGYQFEHRPASLTHLARILWLRGRPDEAMAAAQEAVESAKVIDHPLSLAYALAYAACPVALWCGHEVAAGAYVEELQSCSTEHGLVFWQSWPAIYQAALARRHGSMPPPAFQPGALHVSQQDTMATLHPDFVGPASLARADAGLIPWCVAEIRRADTLRRHARGELDAAAALGQLHELAGLAMQQQAIGWALRIQCSIATLADATSRDAQRDALAKVLGQVHGGAGNQDVELAHRLLAGHAPAAP